MARLAPGCDSDDDLADELDSFSAKPVRRLGDDASTVAGSPPHVGAFSDASPASPASSFRSGFHEVDLDFPRGGSPKRCNVGALHKGGLPGGRKAFQGGGSNASVCSASSSIVSGMLERLEYDNARREKRKQELARLAEQAKEEALRPCRERHAPRSDFSIKSLTTRLYEDEFYKRKKKEEQAKAEEARRHEAEADQLKKKQEEALERKEREGGRDLHDRLYEEWHERQSAIEAKRREEQQRLEAHIAAKSVHKGVHLSDGDVFERLYTPAPRTKVQTEGPRPKPSGVDTGIFDRLYADGLDRIKEKDFLEEQKKCAPPLIGRSVSHIATSGLPLPPSPSSVRSPGSRVPLSGRSTSPVSRSPALVDSPVFSTAEEKAFEPLRKSVLQGDLAQSPDAPRRRGSSTKDTGADRGGVTVEKKCEVAPEVAGVEVDESQEVVSDEDCVSEVWDPKQDVQGEEDTPEAAEEEAEAEEAEEEWVEGEEEEEEACAEEAEEEAEEEVEEEAVEAEEDPWGDEESF